METLDWLAQLRLCVVQFRFWVARRFSAAAVALLSISALQAAFPIGSQLTFRKYLVLAGITIFSTLGDSLLARGMKELGGVSLHNFSGLLFAILNPWVGIGILLLLAFFASYMSALSWADLTYVLPATSLSYVLVAVVARVRFHEHISPTRWLGIALIAAGVGFVAAGPSLTPAPRRSGRPLPDQPDALSQEAKP